MKYLIYLRVSTDKQDVEMQHTMIFNYLNYKHGQNGYEYELFSDPDTTTRLPIEKRLGLSEMLSKLKKGSNVIIYSLDRLSRDIIEMIQIYRKIVIEYKSHLYSTSEGECDELKVGLLGVVAQQVRTLISKKTTDGLKNKKQKGHRYSRWIPYGYSMHETQMVPVRVGNDIVMKPGVLIPLEEEQKVLSVIGELSVYGKSYQDMANDLNQLGYKNRQGKPFQKMSIYRILSRIEHAKSLDQPLVETRPQLFR